MNFLLVTSPNNRSEKIYPLTLSCISSGLKQSGHTVYGIYLSSSYTYDCMVLIKKENIDLIGVEITYQNRKQVLSFINNIKSQLLLPIVALGSYSTVRGEKLLEDEGRGIDYCISGEPEETFLELINAINHKEKLNTVTGLVWRDDGKIVTNPERKQYKHLDSLPFPDRTLFPLKSYTGMICRNKQYTQIVTNRGCPHRCSYCLQYLIEPKIRKRSPGNVVDEMEYLVHNYGIKEIHIEDANFVSEDSERIKQICREIIQRKLKVAWQCAGVIPLAEINDMEMLGIMAEAGCYNISIGVESFHKVITEGVGRWQSTESLSEIIHRCRQNEMEISCHMMIGFPGQTIDQIREDIRISRAYPFDFIHYNIVQFIPGMTLYGLKHRTRTSGRGHDAKILNDSVLTKIQRAAYRSLIIKKSVIMFTLRRLFRPHNTFLIFKKILHYLFGHKSLHVG